MRNSTPRATPVAAAPPPGAAPSASLAAEATELRGPTLVVWRGGQYPLNQGSLLIGRSHECDIMIGDALVSRLHARVRVEPDRVGIEDLHSTNGVYVRGERIAHFATLREGDRALIGGEELSFFRLREELAPESGVGHGSASEKDGATAELEALLGAPPAAATIAPTARAAALEVIGNLARGFARDGRAEEAAAVLIPHLKRILRGVSSGLEAPAALCEQVSHYALDVAVWTADARWLDFIVELHVASGIVMSHATILALQRTERWLGAIDRLLLQYYVESCSSRAASLDESERLRLHLLERLLAAQI